MGIGLTWRGRGCAVVVACSVALAAPSIASAATVSLWHMDETSATTMVDSAGSNNGTLHNVALGQAGASGSAYGFNGSSSVVTAPSSSSLNPGTSPFWMSVQVKFTGTPTAAIGGDYDLIRKGLSGTSGGFYKMELLPTGSGVRAHCSMEGSVTSRSLTAGPDLRDGQWHTVQCLKDDTSISVVVDGVKSSTTVGLGSFGNNASLAVGAKAEGGDWYEGLLDEASFGTGVPGDAAVAPTNTALPAITGTPAVGSPLGASVGAWNGTQPIAYGYQWQRCNAAGAQCSNLTGATGAAYTPILADQGRRLKVVVKATNAGGNRNATSAASAVVGPALPASPAGPGPGATPAAPSAPTAPTTVVSEPDATAAPVTLAVGEACVRVLPAAVLRKAKLAGDAKLTLQFDARTGEVRLRAPHGKVRSISFTLDGRRLSSARGGSLKALLQPKSLARGAHVLRATVHPRHGKVVTLTVHITSASC
jgi:Concanavalin A-like lectin/glucanases superfamily